ncbi:hypothetical protein CLV30_113116 [Haloactinopolyspora alba]|uniref:YcaO domain-containing protein n=1 Tax=Haloactinopolyspora alba TaxID=648780 RepID=A0A2P8DWM7_9ACTN|nr:hypothetical protein [Haloactinopolyspora alba]PSL01628.1 hypothetical protein CLV30_113116 [Haloactinopolyspora alba]
MTTDTPELVRPRMRRDVAFLETLEGVYVRGHDDAFVIRGASAYRYLTALLPHLDGSTPLSELLSGLPDGHADAVRSLVGTLASRGVVVDGPDLQAEYDDDVRARFGSQLALLDHHGDDGDGFRRAASARVAVLADDETAGAALAAGLSANGVGSGDGFVRAGSAAAVRGDLDAGLDLVCFVAVRGPGADLFAVADACRSAGVSFVPLTRVGDLLVLGPREAGGTDVLTAMLRISDNEIDGGADVWRAATAGAASVPPRPVLPGTAASMAVSMAGFEIFKSLTGTISSDIDGSVVLVDPHRLTVSNERLVAHPAADAPGGPASAVPRGPAAGAVSTDSAADEDEGDEEAVERAYTRFESVVADTVGIFRRFDDDAIVQIPVKVAGLIAPAADAEPVVAFGARNVLEARLEALETAAARYALVTHRRCSLLPAPSPEAERVSHDRLDTWLGVPPSDAAPVAATELATGRALAVDRAAALAGPWDRAAACFEPDRVGIAAAESLEQASLRALVDAAGAAAVTALARGEHAVHPVPADLADDGTDRSGHLAMLIREIEDAGGRIALHAATGPVPMAVVRVVDGAGERITAAPGTSWTRAALSALLRVVGPRQIAGTALAAGEPRPGSTDVLDHAAVGPPVTDPSWLHHEADAETVVARLHADGRGAAAVDLGTPDLAGVTRIVRVLLFRQPTRPELFR